MRENLSLHNKGVDMHVVKRALSDPEAAEYIGMSVSFLKQSRSNGNREHRTPAPPFVKVGRAVRYLTDDLDAWLESYRQEPK